MSEDNDIVIVHVLQKLTQEIMNELSNLTSAITTLTASVDKLAALPAPGTGVAPADVQKAADAVNAQNIRVVNFVNANTTVTPPVLGVIPATTASVAQLPGESDPQTQVRILALYPMTPSVAGETLTATQQRIISLTAPLTPKPAVSSLAQTTHG
jgi:hypothetical protein